MEEVADSKRSSGERPTPSSTTGSRSDIRHTTCQGHPFLRDIRSLRLRNSGCSRPAQALRNIPPLLQYSRRRPHNPRVYKPAGSLGDNARK